MMDFLRYLVRTETDHVYNNFSIFHILLLIVFFGGFFVLVQMSQHRVWKTRLKNLERTFLFIMVLSQGIYFAWFFVLGVGGDRWPLYVCRLACILILVTYFFHWKPLEAYSIYTAFYGGISSVFWATPKPYAFPHVTRLAFFGTHISLAYAALLRILLHKEEIDRKSLLGAEAVNLVTITVVLILNIIFDWNYMFLMSPELPIDLGTAHPVLQILKTLLVVLVYLFATWAAWMFARWLQKRYGAYEEPWPEIEPLTKDDLKFDRDRLVHEYEINRHDNAERTARERERIASEWQEQSGRLAAEEDRFEEELRRQGEESRRIQAQQREALEKRKEKRKNRKNERR